MQIPLRERNSDVGLAKCFVDCKAYVARNLEAGIDIGNKATQFEKQSAIAEVTEKYVRFRCAQNILMIGGTLQENVADLLYV